MKKLYLVMALILMASYAYAANPYHETVAAGTSTVTVTLPNRRDNITIVPTADVVATFSPNMGDSDGVLIPTGGFTFTGVEVYSVTFTRAVSAAVEVWAW